MIKKTYYLPTALFLSTTLLYLYTMPPTVYWQDAGIYLSGIKDGGIVYPPGFPIYMILEIVWTHIVPIGNFTQKVHAFSAAIGGLVSVLTYMVALNLQGNISTLFSKKNLKEGDNSIRKSTPESFNSSQTKLLKICFAVVSSVMVSLNFNFWAQSINAEVYALHTLFFIFLLYLVVKLGINGRIEKDIDSKRQNIILSIVIVYGLSFGNHPMTVLLVPLFIYLSVWQKNIFFHKRLITLSLALFVIVGLLPYLYLPIIANTHPHLNWGNPNSVSRFIAHVTGKTYLTGEKSFVFDDISRYQAALQEFVWEFNWLGIILFLVSSIVIFKKNKHISALLSLTILVHLVFAIFYKQTTEYNSWLIPAHIAIILILITGSYHLLLSLPTKVIRIAFSLILVIYLASLTVHWYQSFLELDRRNYYYAQDFGQNILRPLPPNSLLILTGDQEASTILYLQDVLGFRTDIITFKNIEVDELSYTDGRNDLRIRHPGINIPETIFNHPPQGVDPEWYLSSLIDANLSTRPVYLMSKNLIQIDPLKFDLTPENVSWKVTAHCESDCPVSTIDLNAWNFHYHDPNYYLRHERPLMSLKDPSKPGGINRVPFLQHMINFELQSWKNLGDWYITKGQCDEAEKAYNKMTKVQPDIFQKLPAIPASISQCKGE